MKGSMCWLFHSICYCAIPQFQVKQPEYLLGQLVCSHSGRCAAVGKPEERQLLTQVVVFCSWQAILYHKIFSASTRTRTELESYWTTCLTISQVTAPHLSLTPAVQSRRFWLYCLLKQDSEPRRGGYFLTAFAFLSGGSSRTHKTRACTQWERLTRIIWAFPILQPVVPTDPFETLRLPTKCQAFLAGAILILSTRNQNANASRMSNWDLETPKWMRICGTWLKSRAVVPWLSLLFGSSMFRRRRRADAGPGSRRRAPQGVPTTTRVTSSSSALYSKCMSISVVPVDLKPRDKNNHDSYNWQICSC